MLAAVQRGILGGTFDPPHLAHLVAGEAAYRALGLDVVTFLPAGAPWQKAKSRVSDPEHRWQMTVLATEGVDYFQPDDRELRREGWTFTIDTLATFSPAEELILIMGADSAAGLPTWHRWEDLLRRTRLAVIPRLGISRQEVEREVPRPLAWVDMPALPLSGTMLRERVGAGESIRFLVPDSVWRYIRAQGLYDVA